MVHRLFSFALSAAWLVANGSARADEAAPLAGPPEPTEAGPKGETARLQPREARGRYFDLLGTVMLGDGLRFNNPYRLPRQLGTARESVSATATYLELAIGATTGAPDSITHGARLSWTVSLEGVAQQVVTPAYYAQYRFLPSWALFGWVGLPILLEPDVNLGGEFALGAAWFARAGLGVVLALVGDGFYGAGTRETKLPFYPVISGQLGIIINYEVLP